MTTTINDNRACSSTNSIYKTTCVSVADLTDGVTVNGKEISQEPSILSEKLSNCLSGTLLSGVDHMPNPVGQTVSTDATPTTGFDGLSTTNNEDDGSDSADTSLLSSPPAFTDLDTTNDVLPSGGTECVVAATSLKNTAASSSPQLNGSNGSAKRKRASTASAISAVPQLDGSVSSKSSTKSMPVPYAAATADEKKIWKGWITLESEPLQFNAILRELKIDGVKLVDVVTLDADIVAYLPQPIYGLIYCFRFQDGDEGTQQNVCPPHVWFANQVHGTNACGSVALINMVFNVDDVRLGAELQRFKDKTASMSSAARGKELNVFEAVRARHNSFARKIDMLDLDLGRREERALAARNASKAKKTTAAAAKRAANFKRKAKNAKPIPSAVMPDIESSDDPTFDVSAPFHYVAYMKIGHVIWKLDGLDNQPQNIGDCRDVPWLDVIAPLLREQMNQLVGSSIEFNIMALVKDPIIDKRFALARNINLLQAIESRLASVEKDWRSFADDADNQGVIDGLIVDVDDEHGISAEILASSPLSPSEFRKLHVDHDANTLLEFRKNTISGQVALRFAVWEDQQVMEDEAKAAEALRKDYGPFVQAWLHELATVDELNSRLDVSQRHGASKKTSKKQKGARVKAGKATKAGRVTKARR